MKNDEAINVFETYLSTGHVPYPHELREASRMAISALKGEMPNGGELPIEFYDKLHDVDQAAFQNGKKYMREQMLKEAEECELYWDGDFLAIDLNMAALGYSERDKVRVIVLPKEDEK